MSNYPELRFTGKGRQKTIGRPDAVAVPEPYKATDSLVDAVNLAIYLGRPLLLEGEAGSGKSRLARAVAYELELPLYTWAVRSTSKAEEGLYTYDAILRLYDVQTVQAGLAQNNLGREPGNPADYRALGALGVAFTQRDYPAVVLIDEIDKADVDFPNDLLNVLDDPWSFHIRETGETITAAHRPIVIITSNKEKGNLPAPFLRRCVYYYVNFPEDEGELRAIIDLHYKQREQRQPLNENLVQAAIRRFLAIRGDNLFKKPATSELLDWVLALHNYGDEPYSADRLAEEPAVPYPELLYKLSADIGRSISAPLAR